MTNRQIEPRARSAVRKDALSERRSAANRGSIAHKVVCVPGGGLDLAVLLLEPMARDAEQGGGERDGEDDGRLEVKVRDPLLIVRTAGRSEIGDDERGL